MSGGGEGIVVPRNIDTVERKTPFWLCLLPYFVGEVSAVGYRYVLREWRLGGQQMHAVYFDYLLAVF